MRLSGIDRQLLAAKRPRTQAPPSARLRHLSPSPLARGPLSSPSHHEQRNRGDYLCVRRPVGVRHVQEPRRDDGAGQGLRHDRLLQRACRPGRDRGEGEKTWVGRLRAHRAPCCQLPLGGLERGQGCFAQAFGAARARWAAPAGPPPLVRPAPPAGTPAALKTIQVHRLMIADPQPVMPWAARQASACTGRWGRWRRRCAGARARSCGL